MAKARSVQITNDTQDARQPSIARSMRLGAKQSSSFRMDDNAWFSRTVLFEGCGDAEMLQGLQTCQEY